MQNKAENLEKTADILQKGGVLVMATDTVYGLVADANNPQAIDKIYQIKQRDYSKKLAIFAPSVEWICNVCKVGENALNILNHCLPGGFTFILKIKPGLHFPWLQGEDIGIRIPNSEFILQLLAKINQPLVATSANLSGMQDSSIFSKISPDVKQVADLCIFDKNTDENMASSVIDLTDIENNWKYRVLRETKYINTFKECVDKITNY